MNKNQLLIGLCFFAATGFTQTEKKFWVPVKETKIEVSGEREIIPKKYKTFHTEGTILKEALFAAPNEVNVKVKESKFIITLPMPDGSLQQFRVVESSIMEKPLADTYRNIRTYLAQGIDNPYASGRLDWTEFGFHGMIRTQDGDVFIDPYCRKNISDYITYYSYDFEKDPSKKLPEVGVIENPDKKKAESDGIFGVNAVCQGPTLRKYRLAVGCTHQYAQAATGLPNPTKAQTLAKVVISVNRVDQVYETEVAVRLVLVANDTLVLFTSATGAKLM